MVTFKNGILRIEKNEKDNLFRMLFEICLYIGMIFYFLAFSSLHYVGVAALIAGPAIITADKLYSRKLNNITLSVWYILFIVYAELSALWAYSPYTSALKYVKFMMVALVVCFGMTQYVNNKDDLEKLLNIYLYASLSITLIEFIGTPFSKWFDGYFGSAVGGGNTNTFGFIILYASVIGFYKAYILHKRLWYPAVALFLFGCILSSSRKAVIMSVFGIVFIILFAFRRKHHFLHFFLAVGAAVFAFILFMTNDMLYDAIGNRLETLIDFVNDEATKVGSLQHREFYIDFAKDLFRRQPMIGQGFANFATILALETTSDAIYAHNNYWEILADLGLIGFALYYWLYFFMLIKLVITFFQKKFTYLNLMALALLVSEFILEWGVISMYSLFYQMAVSIIFLCATVNDNGDKKQFYYSSENYKLSGGE